MAVEKSTTTTTPVTEQITEELEITVRVTNNASGTLFDAVKESLNAIPGVATVTLIDNVAISPRNGKTNVTVIADITVTGPTTTAGVVELVDDAICIEGVASTSVT